MAKWLEFEHLAEFLDRNGNVRYIRGCSLAGRFEFADRLESLDKALKVYPDRLWVDLYNEDLEFRHLIDRCLKLNGIKPKWCTPSMIEQLIFFRSVEGELVQGWLVELNFPPPINPSTSSSIDTLPQAIAALNGYCNDLNKALELAHSMPATLLTDILESNSHNTDSDKSRSVASLKDKYKDLI